MNGAALVIPHNCIFKEKYDLLAWMWKIWQYMWPSRVLFVSKSFHTCDRSPGEFWNITATDSTEYKVSVKNREGEISRVATLEKSGPHLCDDI